MRGANSRPEWIAKAKKAETAGFSTLLMPDHLVGTRMAMGPALVLAAEATTRLRVGSFVFDNDLRHPAVLAQEIATIDLLCEGRFEFGIGAGWMRSEYDKAGIPFEAGRVRVDRLAEALTIIKELLGAEPVNFAGTHYRIDDLEGTCKPVQRPHPPILIGGGGRRLLSIAAAHANIISLMPRSKRDGAGLEKADATRAAFDAKIAIIREAAGDGFDRLEFNTLIQDVVISDDRQSVIERLKGDWQMGAEDLLESPLLLVGTADQMRDKLRSMREGLGISYIAVHEKDMDALASVMQPLLGT